MGVLEDAVPINHYYNIHCKVEDRKKKRAVFVHEQEVVTQNPSEVGGGLKHQWSPKISFRFCSAKFYVKYFPNITDHLLNSFPVFVADVL